MAAFQRIDPDGDLNTGKSLFLIVDSFGNQVQLSQEEAVEFTVWAQSFLNPWPSLHEQQEREQVLRQIVEGLFQIAEPSNVKSSLWARYQGLSSTPRIVESAEDE